MIIVYKLLAAGLFAIMNPVGTGDPSKVKPLGVLQGHDTLIEFPLVRMITDAKSWGELWSLHKGAASVPTAFGSIANGDAKPTPTVDFEKNQVLIVFGGQMASVQAFDYLKTAVRDKEAVIQLAPSLFPGTSTRVIMTPYIMLVLPKEKVVIDVELDSLSQDGAHYWNQIAKFAIPKDKK